MELKLESIPTKFIISNLEIIPLVQGADKYWRDPSGVIYALHDDASSVDYRNACGVGFFSLPDWPIFKSVNEICGVHDYMYSSPVFQAYHSRAEADLILEQLLALKDHPLVGSIFSEVSHLLGAPFWENPRTR